jgi:hypothetical protein
MVKHFVLFRLLYVVLISISVQSAAAFSISSARRRRTSNNPAPRGRTAVTTPFASFSPSALSSSKDDLNKHERAIVENSTLTLLEVVHLNVNGPKNHEYGHSLYLDVLGCGLHPRTATNLQQKSEVTASTSKPGENTVLWANCGPSQFHWLFSHGDGKDSIDISLLASPIPCHIGLRFDSLESLKRRLKEAASDDGGGSSKSNTYRGIQSFHIETDPRTKRDCIRLVDMNNNVFYCREGDPVQSDTQQQQKQKQQPIIGQNETEVWGELATRYGRLTSDCCGVAYLEFPCPPNSAAKIALFYESVLDATTTVLPVPGSDKKVAMIAIGGIDESGRPDQSLLFRETDEVFEGWTTQAKSNEDDDNSNKDDNEYKNNSYHGHHRVALYVGESAADFEQGFKNADLADLIWSNPRFSDNVITLQDARNWKQFRFKDIVDMETGDLILELEHELRSIEYDAWPREGTSFELVV